MDFYCCNDKEVYLLRLRNRAIKKLDIAFDNQKLEYPKYLIAEFSFEKIDDNLILKILSEFEENESFVGVITNKP
jgi:hypothetical protein